MRLLITWPMVLLLLIKCWLLQLFLKMAQEQTGDGIAIACSSCSQPENRCEKPRKCRVQRLKDRERLLSESIARTEERIARLASA